MSRLATAPTLAGSGRHVPDVVVLELSAGQWEGGHHRDYLQALLDALGDCRPEVRAPYLERAAPTGRIARRLHDLRTVWRTFAPSGERRIVVTQAPSPWEILFLRLTVALRRGPLPLALVVLRRTDEIERGLGRIRAALARRSVDHLITRRRIWPASDSQQVLDALERRTGVRGTRLAIPLRVSAAPGVPSHDGPVVALLGAFRLEKGARHYDAVVTAAVETMPDSVVDVQIGRGAGDGSELIADALVERWVGHPRVRLHDAYLPREVYMGLLHAADVIVVPYDVDLYGTGTSGVLHEAVALGCTVVATPIAWAVAEYGEHPRVVLLDRMDEQALRAVLPRVCEDAVARRPERGAVPDDDGFAASWSEAVRAAVALSHRVQR